MKFRLLIAVLFLALLPGFQTVQAASLPQQTNTETSVHQSFSKKVLEKVKPLLPKSEKKKQWLLSSTGLSLAALVAFLLGSSLLGLVLLIGALIALIIGLV